MTFSLLVVCTGNVCRSPLAQEVLRAGLLRSGVGGAGGAGGAVTVTSAGTRALVGAPMPAEARALAAAAGGDGTGHQARQLVDGDLERADLVLVATRAHRTAVVGERPALLRRTFTLREAGRLAALVADQLPDAAPDERLAALAALLPAARGRWPGRGEDDDVVDPYRGGAALWRRCGAELLPALDVLLATAAGPLRGAAG